MKRIKRVLSSAFAEDFMLLGFVILTIIVLIFGHSHSL